MIVHVKNSQQTEFDKEHLANEFKKQEDITIVYLLEYLKSKKKPDNCW